MDLVYICIFIIQNGPDSSKEGGVGTDMNGTLSFQELLNDLPQNVSTHMAKNLSVPIAFVCLLHLANEKVGFVFIIALYLQIL